MFHCSIIASFYNFQIILSTALTIQSFRKAPSSSHQRFCGLPRRRHLWDILNKIILLITSSLINKNFNKWTGMFVFKIGSYFEYTISMVLSCHFIAASYNLHCCHEKKKKLGLSKASLLLYLHKPLFSQHLIKIIISYYYQKCVTNNLKYHCRLWAPNQTWKLDVIYKDIHIIR